MDLPKLVSLVMRRELALTRMDLLPDKFEGHMGKRFRAVMTKWAERELFKEEGDKQAAATQSAEPAGGVIPREQAIANVAKLHLANARHDREVAYVSCWCSGDYESEAMWRLYCPSGAGVALVLPYERLRDSFSDPALYIGMVQYVNLDEAIINWGNAFNALMCKRLEFVHEREVRIVKLAAEFSEGYQDGTMSLWRGAPDRPSYLPVPWNPEEHLERIVVSPYASPWHADLIAQLLKILSPGLESRVIASGMGGEPDW